MMSLYQPAYEQGHKLRRIFHLSVISAIFVDISKVVLPLLIQKLSLPSRVQSNRLCVPLLLIKLALRK